MMGMGHLVSILGGRLPSRTVGRDVRRHAVFVVAAPAVAGLGGKLVEISPLDGLQPVGNAMRRRISPGCLRRHP